MKNVKGEEINEELYLKKVNEKLAEISNYIEDCKEDSYLLNSDELINLINDYGMIYYMYGAYNAKKI